MLVDIFTLLDYLLNESSALGHPRAHPPLFYLEGSGLFWHSEGLELREKAPQPQAFHVLAYVRILNQTIVLHFSVQMMALEEFDYRNIGRFPTEIWDTAGYASHSTRTKRIGSPLDGDIDND